MIAAAAQSAGLPDAYVVAAAIVVSSIGATWRISNRFGKIESLLQNLSDRLVTLERRQLPSRPATQLRTDYGHGASGAQVTGYIPGVPGYGSD